MRECTTDQRGRLPGDMNAVAEALRRHGGRPVYRTRRRSGELVIVSDDFARKYMRPGVATVDADFRRRHVEELEREIGRRVR